MAYEKEKMGQTGSESISSREMADESNMSEQEPVKLNIGIGETETQRGRKRGKEQSTWSGLTID
jgi:hypothetical protein